MHYRNPLRLFAALLLVAGLQFGVAPHSVAHGEAAARFGGIVKASQDISFELVAAAKGGAEVYLDDHGELMVTTGITGKMTVIGKEGRKEAPLVADGKRLSASGLNPASGDRVVVVVTLPSQQTISVRYAVP